MYLLHELLHGLLVSNVADVTACVDALCLIVGKSLVEVFLTTAVECYACTGSSQCLCDGKAYTIGATCNESVLALK